MRFRSPLSSSNVLLVNLIVLMIHAILYTRRPSDDSPRQRGRGDNDCPQLEQQGYQDGHDVWVDDWDGMHEEVMGVPGLHWTNRRIFLIRHGQYKGEGDEQGHLSSLGIKQMHLAGKRLRDSNLTFHKFYASTSIRAQESAKVVHEYFPKMEIESSALLKEGRPTFPQPPINTWDPHDEEFEKDGARIEEAFRTFLHRPSSTQPHTTNEIIVAHGNVISYFTLRVLQVPAVRWVSLSIMQGSITMMELSSNGHVTVRIVGDVGHIPKNMWTG